MDLAWGMKIMEFKFNEGSSDTNISWSTWMTPKNSCKVSWGWEIIVRIKDVHTTVNLLSVKILITVLGGCGNLLSLKKKASYKLAQNIV